VAISCDQSLNSEARAIPTIVLFNQREVRPEFWATFICHSEEYSLSASGI
jgi:hypothetical protein